MDLRSHKVLVLDSSADVVRCIHGLDELLKPASYVRPIIPTEHLSVSHAWSFRTP